MYDFDDTWSGATVKAKIAPPTALKRMPPARATTLRRIEHRFDDCHYAVYARKAYQIDGYFFAILNV